MLWCTCWLTRKPASSPIGSWRSSTCTCVTRNCDDKEYHVIVSFWQLKVSSGLPNILLSNVCSRTMRHSAFVDQVETSQTFGDQVCVVSKPRDKYCCCCCCWSSSSSLPGIFERQACYRNWLKLVWFTCDSCLIHVWFMFDSYLIHIWFMFDSC